MKNFDVVVSAIRKNDLWTVRRLLKENPYLFHINDRYCWPIMHLCLAERCVDLELVKLFVRSGGNVNEKTNSGLSLVFLAATMPSLYLIQNYLESCGARMSSFEEAVALLIAGKEGKNIEVEIVRLLEKEQNLICAIGDRGYTLLHHAVSNFHYSVAAILIERGADPNALTFSGRSLLGFCGEPTDSEGMTFYELLIRKRVIYTPLERLEKMIRDGQDGEAIQWLKSNHGMINAWIPSASGPVLHCAVWLSHGTKVAEYLLKSGVDPDTSNEVEQTALHRVMCRTLSRRPATLSLIRLLVDARANINQPDENGYTPLHEAVSHGWDEPPKLLVELGADLNLQTNNGETALDIVYKMRFLGGKSLAHWMKSKGATLGKRHSKKLSE
jgi:ankyrin repeat protein